MSNHAFANYMTNTTGGLSRLWCENCAEESLHRGNACTHCRTVHRAYPVKNIAMLMRMGPDTRKRKKLLEGIHHASVMRGARRGAKSRARQ